MRNYWIIGDIHGEISLLDRLLEQVRKYEPERVVFVGDYIDRGPASREVIDRLMNLDMEAYCLMGNHELMMLDAISGNGFSMSPMELWYYNGAESTLRSFGLHSFYELEGGLEPRYLGFLRNLPLMHRFEPVEGVVILVSHAGISPALDLEGHLEVRNYNDLNRLLQRNNFRPEDSPLWVRESFFTADPDSWGGCLVIHGHTPVEKLYKWATRAGRDDFAFIGQDLAIRRNLQNATFASLDVDSGSVISGRLSGVGILVEDPDPGKPRIRLKSITVSGQELVPRDHGLLPIGRKP